MCWHAQPAARCSNKFTAINAPGDVKLSSGRVEMEPLENVAGSESLFGSATSELCPARAEDQSSWAAKGLQSEELHREALGS